MNSQNVLYCKNCRVVEVDSYNLMCDKLGGCNEKKQDLGMIKTIEEALWIGIKLGVIREKDGKGVAVSPSLNWELEGSPVPDNIPHPSEAGW